MQRVHMGLLIDPVLELGELLRAGDSGHVDRAAPVGRSASAEGWGAGPGDRDTGHENRQRIA